jgi:hypothetical protein
MKYLWLETLLLENNVLELEILYMKHIKIDNFIKKAANLNLHFYGFNKKEYRKYDKFRLILGCHW